MAETDEQPNQTARRETPWPGGARAIEQPPALLPVQDPLEYFADSDLADNDPNWTGLWPNEIEPEPAAPAGDPQPRADDPQIPPRAWPPDMSGASVPFVPEIYTPEPVGETVRRSGLAWSAGVVFFGSVAFMLFLGWLADLLLGSSPWGIVGGIVLGSIIGFVQFFRITSQIFNSKNAESQMRPLMPPDDEDK